MSENAQATDAPPRRIAVHFADLAMLSRLIGSRVKAGKVTVSIGREEPKSKFNMFYPSLGNKNKPSADIRIVYVLGFAQIFPTCR